MQRCLVRIAVAKERHTKNARLKRRGEGDKCCAFKLTMKCAPLNSPEPESEKLFSCIFNLIHPEKPHRGHLLVRSRTISTRTSRERERERHRLKKTVQ